MTDQTPVADDVVDRLIKHCHQNAEAAEKLFDQMIAHQQQTVQLPDGDVNITEEQRGEFAERYSAEVGPTLWESKRRKT